MANQKRKQEIRDRVAAQAALQEACDRLEVQLRERTAQLAQVQETLKAEIHHRQQCETALRESEERLTGTLALAELGTWEWNLLTQEFICCQRSEELFALNRDRVERTLTALDQLVHPDERESMMRSLQKAKQEQSSWHIDCRVIRSDHSIHWLTIAGKFIYNPAGEAVQIRGVVREITQYKQSELFLSVERQTLEKQIAKHTRELKKVHRQLKQEIANHQQTKLAYHKSEETFSTILDHIGAAIFIKDLNNQYTYVNDLTAQLIGCPQKEIIEIEDFNLFTPEITALFKHNDQQVLETEKIANTDDFRWVNNLGEIRHYSIVKIPLKTPDNSIYAIGGIARDITEVKRLEKTLQQTEKRYQAIVEKQTALICRFQADTTILFVNQAFCHYFGQPKETLIREKYETLIFGEDRHNFRQLLQSLNRETPVKVFEFRMVVAGKIRWMQWETQILLHEESSAIEFQSLGRDITEQKEAENALKESEGRWHLALQGNNDGIWDWNVETNVVFFSSRWKEMLGYQEDEIANHLDEWSKRVHPDDLDAVMQMIQAHFAQETPFYLSEHRLLCKDGTYKWILDRGQALWDSAGNVIRMIGSHTDITERKQAEEELQWKETLLRSMANASPLAFYVVDNKTDEILYFNHRFCEIWGIEHLEESMRQRQLKNNDILPDCANLIADLPSFIESCKPLQSEENRAIVEDEIHFKDGRIIRRFSSQVRNDRDRYFGRMYLFEDITKRKQIETELRLSDFSIECSSLATVWIDPDGRILRANQAACEQIGYPREELLTMRVWQTDPNFPREKWSEHWQTLKEQKTLSFTSEQYTKDGRILPVDITLNYLEFDGKEYNFACAHDISDRKLAESALLESEQRFRAIFNQTFQFTGLLQPNGKVLELNQTALNFSGVNRDEVIDQFIWDTQWCKISLAAKNQLKAAIARAAKGEFMRYETNILGMGDRVATIDFSVRPIFDESEQVKLLILEGRDITKRKEMEAALRDSKQMLSTILDNAGACIFIKDIYGCYTYVNRLAVDVFACPIEEIIGAQDIKFFPPKVAQVFRENDRQVIETGNPIHSQEQVSLKNSQLVRYFWVVKVPLKRADGRVYGICGIATDITELKQTEAALRQSESTLRSFFNSKSMLMGIVELHDNDILHLSDNDTAAQFFGTTPEQMQNRFASELGTPRSHLDLWLKNYREAIRTQAPVQFEYAHQTPTGEKWLSASFCPIATSASGLPRLSYIVEDISDRKRVEQALKESQKRLELALEASGDGLWDWNVATGEGYLSPRYEEMLGYEPGELNLDLGIWERLIHPEDLPSAKAILEAHFKDSSIPYAYEYRLRTKSGDWKWVSNYGKVVIRDADGTPLRMTGTHRDVNDRKLTEEALRQSQYFLQKVANAAPYILYLFDLTTLTSTYLNEQSINVLGYSPEEMAGADLQWLRNHFHPDDRHIFSAFQTRFINLSDHEVLSTEYRFRHKNGEWRWLNSREVVFSRDGNNIPTQILGTIQDISDRKHAELALRQNEALLKHVTASIPGIIYSFGYYPDGSAKFEYMSQGSVQLFELPPEIILEDAGACLNQIHPDDLEQRDAKVGYAVARVQGFSAEWRNIAPSGKQRWVRAQAEPETRDDGSKVWHGVVLDISDLKATEMALQQALAAAQAASIAKSRFLSNMSHELRTPLNAILGFSQVMARSQSLGDEQKEQLKIINRSGEHLLNLINDILSVSKIESGQITLNPAPFDLYELLDDLEKMLQLKAASKGIQLTFEGVLDIPQYVVTDQSKLRQVLINLLGNAIKFTQQGSVSLTVKLRQKPENFQSNSPEKLQPKFSIEFMIKDTGPGIDPDEMKTLFTPFVQTETGRQSMQGTGLGLTISREFVRLMGGEISVSSELNQGTIFTFYIVLSQAEGICEKPTLITQRVMGLEPNQSTYRVLVVEDVAENRQLLVKLLEPLGFEVCEAVNGKEAIALWSTWKPHLIWMDMRMPIMDGYEATKQIKAKEKQQLADNRGLQIIRDRLQKQQLNQPQPKKLSDFTDSSSPSERPSQNFVEQFPIHKTIIIALTASAFDEERNKILAVGCDDFVHKPFQESVLFEKMAQHLGVRYLYAEEDQPTASQSLEPPKQLTSEDLSVMSPEWIAQLHHAVLCADDQLILTLIQQIPDTDATLANSLTDLVNNFRLDLLFNLTQAFAHE